MHHIPKIGDFAAVKPRFGRIGAVLRPAAHYRFGVLRGGGQQLGSIVQTMLRIGIHLQHMGVAVLFGIIQPVFHRRPLAAVGCAVQHRHALPPRRFFQHRLAVRMRTVVND